MSVPPRATKALHPPLFFPELFLQPVPRCLPNIQADGLAGNGNALESVSKALLSFPLDPETLSSAYPPRFHSSMASGNTAVASKRYHIESSLPKHLAGEPLPLLFIGCQNVIGCLVYIEVQPVCIQGIRGISPGQDRNIERVIVLIIVAWKFRMQSFF